MCFVAAPQDVFRSSSPRPLPPPPGRICRGMLFQEGKVEERSGGVRMHVLSSGMRGMNTNLPGTLVMEDTCSAEVQTRVVSRTGIAQEGGRTHGKWGRPGPQGVVHSSSFPAAGSAQPESLPSNACSSCSLKPPVLATHLPPGRLPEPIPVTRKFFFSIVRHKSPVIQCSCWPR